METDTHCCRLMGLSAWEWLFLLGCAVCYGLWAIVPPHYAPDEWNRFLVTQFLFEHGRLPVGTECMMPLWGFSYAHRPTLLVYVLGAGFMRLADWFGVKGDGLLLAARMVSVLFGVGTVYWVLRIARLLFSSVLLRMLLVSLVALLPQFAFLSGYINNDIAAIFGSTMIVYAWVYAWKRKWTVMSIVVLAVGMSVCLSSYENSYGWVLLSAIYLPLSYLYRNGRIGLERMMALAALVTVVLAGFFFVRQFMLYGDLFGLATEQRYASLYADPAFRPEVRITLKNSGAAPWRTPIHLLWTWWTLSSCIGVFGHMVYFLPMWCYAVYACLFGVLAWGASVSCVRWLRSADRKDSSWDMTLLLGALLVCGTLMPLLLSLYRSYAIDFQPQGRYCMPGLVSMAVLLTVGFGGSVRRSVLPFAVFSFVTAQIAVLVQSYWVLLSSFGKI